MTHEPDLTGYSARERRIFALGVNWVVGQVVAGCVGALRDAAARPDIYNRLPANEALEAVADGFAATDLGYFTAVAEGAQP